MRSSAARASAPRTCATRWRRRNLDTVVGPVKWGGQGPFKNVSKTPLVLGQWGKGTKYKVELTIVDNAGAKNIPTGGTLKLI